MNIERVIIADNQSITAYALEHLARVLQPGIVVDYATRYDDLVRLLRNTQVPTAVILDFTLFDFQNQEQLVLLADSNSQKVNWLLVSDELSASFLRYVLYNSDKIGVVFKDAPVDTIQQALQDTLKGEQYVSQHATRIILRKPVKEEVLQDPLTQTEREVLRLIAQGKTSKEIAAERFSSIHTINSHRKNIFRKLNVNCVHDAIKCALRSGIVDESEFYI